MCTPILPVACASKLLSDKLKKTPGLFSAGVFCKSCGLCCAHNTPRGVNNDHVNQDNQCVDVSVYIHVVSIFLFDRGYLSRQQIKYISSGNIQFRDMTRKMSLFFHIITSSHCAI